MLYDISYISWSIYKWYKNGIILNILKQCISCGSRHKEIKSVLNCIYCFLDISSHASLMLFPNLKTKEYLKYPLLIVKLSYRLVSIWSAYGYNSIRCLFSPSMDIELEYGRKVIPSFPNFCFNSFSFNYMAYFWKINITKKLFHCKYKLVPFVNSLCSVLRLLYLSHNFDMEVHPLFYHFINK